MTFFFSFFSRVSDTIKGRSIKKPLRFPTFKEQLARSDMVHCAQQSCSALALVPSFLPPAFHSFLPQQYWGAKGKRKVETRSKALPSLTPTVFIHTKGGVGRENHCGAIRYWYKIIQTTCFLPALLFCYFFFFFFCVFVEVKPWVDH